MKRTLFILALFLLPGPLLWSQLLFPDSAVLNVNNVRVHINSYGIQFNQLDSAYTGHEMFQQPGFEFPAGSGIHTVFTSSLWLSGRCPMGGLYISADRYLRMNEPPDFVAGPLDAQGQIHTDTMNKYNRVWTITRTHIDDFRQWYLDPSSMPGYHPPDDLLEWPAGTSSHPMAPFVDVNNDQQYDPLASGDYPDILGDQAAFIVLNDVGGGQGSSGGNPMHMEVQALFYAFNCPQSKPMHNTLFAKYKIINRSQRTYNDFLPTIFMDMDIANPFDDFVGTDVSNGMGFTYTSLPGSYPLGDTAMASGTIILRGPEKPDNQKDDPLTHPYAINGIGFGDGVIDNEFFGLTHSMYNARHWGGILNPCITGMGSDYMYNMARGFWSDSLYLSYGGSGCDTTGQGLRARYFFPGDSDSLFYGTHFQVPAENPVWEAHNSILASDCQLMLSSGDSISFAPGDQMILDVAYTNAMVPQGSYDEIIGLLRSYADSLNHYYRTDNPPCGHGFSVDVPPQISYTPDEVNIFPNPADGYLNIHPEFCHPYQARIYHITGQTLMNINNLSGNARLNIQTLSPGIYLLEIRTKKGKVMQKFVKY